MTNLKSVADDVLEASVIGSFTAIGFEARRRLFEWEDLRALAMDEKIVLITGGSSGLGLEAAKELAGMGARVRIVVRDAERGEAAREEIAAAGPGDVRGYLADLSSLASVRMAAAAIRDAEPHVDVLIHNAGALLPERHTSVDGREMTFATMVLGPFLLTNELFPLLRSARGARVLWVSSGGMYTQPLDVDALEMGAEDYRGSVAYARAKRAQVCLAQEGARHMRGDGIVVHAMHPGWVDTPGLQMGLPGFRTLLGPILRTPRQGVDTMVWLAAAEVPGRSSGRFWLDRRPRSTHKLVRSGATPEERARLWELCERLTREG